ncbi:HAD family hydrolase [Mesobaculum littorinae]|nr:HAD family phosphatase [Mesobaculum littorinae]
MSKRTLPAPIAAVIFDLDGLLLDTERLALEAGAEAMAELGHPLGQAFLLTLVGADAQANAARINAHLGTDYDAARITSAWNAALDRRTAVAGVPVKPGAPGFLADLARRGLPFAVATNSHTANAESKIERSALAGQVPVLVGVDQVRAGKPAPDVYLEAARRLGVAPRDAVAFEDSDLGARAARTAGLFVVQIPDATRPSPGLAHMVAETLGDGARAVGLAFETS